jgi:hypothetical protein
MGDDASRELWYSAQAMMTAVANVHKALWGNGKGDVATREPVRLALAIDTDSAISLEARKMRNNFDHYEDRIRTWAESREGLMLEGVGPRPLIDGHTQMALWRSYDPATDTLSFWDSSLSLTAIEQEAQRLIPIAEDIARQCPECMDEGREHRRVTFPIRRGFPAEADDPREWLAEADDK